MPPLNRDDAIRAYEAHCQETGETPSDEERQAWIDEWAELEAEYQEAAAEAYWAEQRRYFKDGV